MLKLFGYIYNRILFFFFYSHNLCSLNIVLIDLFILFFYFKILISFKLCHAYVIFIKILQLELIKKLKKRKIIKIEFKKNKIDTVILKFY